MAQYSIRKNPNKRIRRRKRVKNQRYVYLFSEEKTDGDAGMKDLLGGKGANLAEMSRFGISVPPGFTITTGVCAYYYAHARSYPPGLVKQTENVIKKLERITGFRFGDPSRPLLLSVRSGARVSMPGMMDTILNLGLNDESVKGLAEKTQNERFAYDSYRRFIQMYGNVVMGIDHDEFERILEEKKSRLGVKEDSQLDPASIGDIIQSYRRRIRKVAKSDIPQDPYEQLWGAIGAVFGSWNNGRAVSYREIHGIPHDWGTAVNVQSMVFGNMGATSGTGVCFSRNPTTGENVFYGDFLVNAQGEDVVAGTRTPGSIAKKRAGGEGKDSLEELMPPLFKKLRSVVRRLELHYRDLQDVEFTIQEGKLWILQTRSGKRTPGAAVTIAVDMVREKLISRNEAILRVDPYQVEKLLHPTFEIKGDKKVLARGLPASPGAAVGRAVFSPERAEELSREGEKVILVRTMTSPEDIRGMAVAEGILTQVGGLTSHAALVSRGMGKCCVVGCSAIEVNYRRREFRAGNIAVREGDVLSLDGSTGEVMRGELPLVAPQISSELTRLLSWADDARLLQVRANADTPLQARGARLWGAEGIGLARTEHMFFEEGRIEDFRAMILADDETERARWLENIFLLQKKDFVEIFREMRGVEVTVRLLDPPLHEFLPEGEKEILSLAKKLHRSPEEITEKTHSLREQNPMLGHRGIRLGITHPEIYDMQIRAILEAAIHLTKRRTKVFPEIMFPLVATLKEFVFMGERVKRIAQELEREHGALPPYKVGTMIEVPRSALIADKLAVVSQFFSFGTNDLTQTTFAISRDDIGSFLPRYIEDHIFEGDPFSTIDEDGVGELMAIAVEKARKTSPGIKIGICGEHGGDPKTIAFCHRLGLDYVSASPWRVPIARLAAAQAAIKDSD